MTGPRTSNSSGQNVSFVKKVRELLQQYAILQGRFAEEADQHRNFLYKQREEYDRISQTHGAGPLSGLRAFEIGCGQRPYRLLNLLSEGIDVRGVELDRVVFRPTLGSFWENLRDNGAERALKTALRHLLFGKHEQAGMERIFGARLDALIRDAESRIARGNAADEALWPSGDLDFVYSEDVFEHIPKDDLERVCEILARRLSPNGVALIRPMVFTGIRGGHNVEWYNASEGKARRCPPWDHLLDRTHAANTYLNELWLADYRALLERHFDIVEETIANPNIGRWAMTPELRVRLSKYPEEELFSDRVRYILRRKTG